MFRFREESDTNLEEGNSTPVSATNVPDYQVKCLSLKTQNLGKMFSGSKRSYQWTFLVRKPASSMESGGGWGLVSVILTNSSYSHKKSLVVNEKKLINKEKM